MGMIDALKSAFRSVVYDERLLQAYIIHSPETYDSAMAVVSDMRGCDIRVRYGDSGKVSEAVELAAIYVAEEDRDVYRRDLASYIKKILSEGRFVMLVEAVNRFGKRKIMPMSLSSDSRQATVSV